MNKRILGILTLLFVLSFPVAHSAPTLDANGWTVFTPSSDTRTIYVSNSTGSDTNSGLSTSAPVKTIAKGMSLLRDGYPDWLLFKKGDTWTNEAIGNLMVSGRSASEPMLISSYGTGARPLIKTGPSNDNGIASFSGHGDYLAITGLEFYAYTRDPNSPNFDASTLAGQTGFYFLSPGHWLLLEDNKFSFYSVNAIQAWPSGTFQNVSLRRNVIVDDYNATGAHSQGIYTEETNNLLIEENVWDHNGWNSQVPGGESTMFNRSMYLSHGHGTTIVRGNIDANGASGGVQVRVGGTAENNLFLKSPISIVFGSVQNPNQDVSGVIRNNVTLDSRDIDTSWAMGSAIWLSSTANSTDGIVSGPSLIKNLEVYGNIIAHNEQGTNNIAAIRMEGDGAYINTNVHDNIIYDWTRAVWPNPDDHRADGFLITTTAPAVNSSFYNNIIQQPRSGFIGEASNHAGGISFSNNTYWSVEADPPVIWSKGWFSTYESGSVSSANWATYAGETGMKTQQVTFTDPNRSIATYMASLGLTPTYDAFMQRARQQSKDNWDTRFTAAAVNDYIRAGFGITTTQSSPTPPSSPTPLVGDLNLDHIVNALDWSLMNAKWFTTDATTDLNHDGVVNAIDFSLLNANWFKTW